MNSACRIPILAIHGVLLVPIQDSLTDQLAQQVKEDVGRAIQRTGARGVIIDLSAVDILDSYLSNTIHQICSIARLMGARGVLSGVSPTMAMTLVDMGLSLQGVEAALSVEDALDVVNCPIEMFDDQPCDASTRARGEAETDPC